MHGVGVNKLLIDILLKFEQALAYTVENAKIPKHLERCHRLISLLYNKQKFKELLKLAIKTNEIYPRDTFLLEWLCKLYTDLPELVESEMRDKSIDYYVFQLLSANSSSAIGLMAQAINFYRKHEIIAARDIALNGEYLNL